VKTKQGLIITVVGVSLYAALMNLGVVFEAIGKGIALTLPIITGSVLALFVSVPMNGIEKLIKNAVNGNAKPSSEQTINRLSFVMTIILVLSVLFAVLTLLVPEIVTSSQNLMAQIENKAPQWAAYLEAQSPDIQWLSQLLSDIDVNQLVRRVTAGINALLPDVVDKVSSTVGVVTTAVFSVIVCIHISLGRERVCRHAQKLVCAYLPAAWARRLIRFCRLFYAAFSKFLSGQCGEAVILGTLMYLAFLLFRLPYGSLVGLLTTVCAIIPYVGAFISCTVSILLTALLDPTLAIRGAIVYLSIQFVENQFIYPKVVGGYVGLSPLYTLFAAMLGGKLFGILGIIFFIPLISVVIELVKEDANRRLEQKKQNA